MSNQTDIPFGQLFFGYGLDVKDSYGACNRCARLNLLTKDCDGKDVPLGLVHGVTLQPLRAAVEEGHRIQVYFDNYGSPDPLNHDMHRMNFSVSEECDIGALAGQLFRAQVHRNSLHDFNGLQTFKQPTSGRYAKIPA